jgi:quinol monooxygenase YgiN
VALFIVTRFHARPDCEESLRHALEANIEPTRAEPGCRFIHLFRSLRDPALFFIHSEFVSVEEFEIHAELPHTRKMLAVVHDLIDHPLDVNRTEKLA